MVNIAKAGERLKLDDKMTQSAQGPPRSTHTIPQAIPHICPIASAFAVRYSEASLYRKAKRVRRACLGNAQTAQVLLLTVSNRQWTMARTLRAPAIWSSLARRALRQKAKRKSCAAAASWLRAGWSRGVGGRWAVVSAYDGSTNNFCIFNGYCRYKQFLRPQPHTIFTLFFL